MKTNPMAGMLAALSLAQRSKAGPKGREKITAGAFGGTHRPDQRVARGSGIQQHLRAVARRMRVSR